jgi:hypothetical protein
MSTVAKVPREQSQTTFSACLHFILTIIGAKYAPVPFNESCRDFILPAPPARSRFSLGFWRKMETQRSAGANLPSGAVKI